MDTSSAPPLPSKSPLFIEEPASRSSLGEVHSFLSFPPSEQEPTGPRSYPGNGAWLIYCYIVVQFAQRLGVLVYHGMANGMENLVPNEPQWNPMGAIWGGNLFNIWLFGAVIRKPYKIQEPFKLSRVHTYVSFYFLIIDDIVLLGVPILFSVLGVHVTFPLYTGIVMVASNCFVFYISVAYNIKSHDPFKNDYKYCFVGQICDVEPISPFKLIKSTPFQVSFEVIAPLIAGDFHLERNGYRQDTNSWRKTPPDMFSLNFKIEKGTPVGSIVTLIPETHELKGAIKMKGYRSFGINACTEVTTTISAIPLYNMDGKALDKIIYTRLTLEYRKQIEPNDKF